jgi:cysteine desulfuration protein SufE
MNINEKQEKLIKEFSHFNDWFEKYELLIEFGRKMPPMERHFRNEANLIKGCQSSLWIASEIVDGKILYYADSDAKITRGIAAVVLQVVNHQHPEEIVGTELYFLKAIGLTTNLSPSRSNGLAAMLKRIVELAKGQYSTT